MFSKACEYGLRAVIYIWVKSKEGKKLGVQEICHEIIIPEFFTSKILQSLVSLDIISSAKGPNGGYFINEEQEKLKLIDLVDAIDGDAIFKGCALGLKNCSETNPCPLHRDFLSIRNDLTALLKRKTIRELAIEVENGEATLVRL